MSNTQITNVIGRRVWDSRGRPTVEAEIHLAGGAIGRAIAPAGASTGSGEALTCATEESASAVTDVRTAVDNVNIQIADALTRLDAADQTDRSTLML